MPDLVDIGKSFPSREDLVSLARQVARNAHCPYSDFRVGAVVVADGKVYQGANVEISSLGLTLCAERSALTAAIADGAKNITQIVISCIDAEITGGTEQFMPCGACRQWLSDLAPEATVIIDGIGESFTISQLLPSPFRI